MSDGMPDNGLSTLIFCKDNPDNLIDLIQDVYSISDEIILVDSSSTQNRQLLLERKERLKLDKVKIYQVPALGHPEPYQMYGLSKCGYEWVLCIDTDERPNEPLKRKIRSIIEESEYDGYLVRKRELDNNGHRYFDSYQCRLYRKSKATYTGNVFYDPIIDGRETKLEDIYFINHHFDYYENPLRSSNSYFALCAYEQRQSYGDLL
jgi:hypothetical protein